MSDSSDKFEPDVCVIGAGVAGALLAYRLGRAGAKVLILEAGPRHRVEERFSYMQRYLAGDNPWLSENPQRDIYTNGGAVRYPMDQLRVKAVGGTTLHWGGVTPRFHESDFELRSRHGIGVDWPLRYAELEPYYYEAETELGVAGEDDNPFGPPRARPYPLPGFPASYHEEKLRQACKPLGIQFHTLPQARTSTSYRGRPACQTFATCKVCPIRAKYSADWHVELAEATGNVRVLPLANVLRLELDQQGRVKRAVYATSDRVEHQATARLFILAANAVESARLLLLSKSAAAPDGLANSSGTVGKYFMEHIAYGRFGQVDEPLFPYLHGFETIQCEQFYDEPGRDQRPAFILQGYARGPTPPRIAREVIGRSGFWGEDLEVELRNTIPQKFGRTYSLDVMPEPLPIETNRVELDREVNDYFGNPCPRLVYSITAYEKAAMQRADQIIKNIFEALGAHAISDAKVGYGGHQSGTCRMGIDPKTSVVDRNLRAHDVSNLYIVGNSVFPTIGALMPTLTTAALAIRLSDHLLSLR